MRGKQCDAILNFLQEGNSLTSWQAFEEFGATRLASVIHNLRKKGYVINAEDVDVVTRYGRKVTIARYRLSTET